jgi:hypothetical protein
MRIFTILILALAATVPAFASNDAQMVTANTVATEGVHTFYARFVLSSGGGGSPGQYTVSSQSPAGWISAPSAGIDGGNWSTHFTVTYNTGFSAGYVACSATPINNGASTSYGVPNLTQPYTHSGTITVDMGWDGAPQSFFPENGFTLTCMQTT